MESYAYDYDSAKVLQDFVVGVYLGKLTQLTRHGYGVEARANGKSHFVSTKHLKQILEERSSKTGSV